MIEAGLFSLLSTTTSITALCGTRIYPILPPDEPLYPCIVYKSVSLKSNPTLDTTGMQRLRIEFDCFGSRPLDAVNLRTTLVKAINRYQGALSDGTWLQDMVLQSMGDFFDDQARVPKCFVEFYALFNFSS